MSGVRLGVVGATGQVGSVMRRILLERGFPIEEVRFFASARSSGTVLRFGDREVVVEDVERADPTGLDVALFSIGAGNAERIAPRFAEAGCLVIDNSSAFRMDPRVPLVVAEVNPEDLADVPRGIVANPNCTTMIAVGALEVLDRLAGLRRVVASTYQAASGAGRAGVAELADQLARDGLERLTFDGSAVDFGDPSVFPAPLAANVVPLAGSLAGGDTSEELKFVNESRKILHREGLPVVATCVRVPVFTGHAVAVAAECARPVDVDELRRELASSPGLALVDLPTPQAAVGRDEVLVGRVRTTDALPNGVAFFVAGDNLRKGAALNAVQLAELLVGEGARRGAVSIATPMSDLANNEDG